MARVALVGLGYWGPNLLRTFNNLNALAAAFDLDAKNIKKLAKDPVYKHIYFDTEWQKCLGRDDVDGIVVATPPNTHFDIAKESILGGKHVFIEKPMTLDVKEAEELVELAKKHNKIILVGHIFLYSPEIIKLKEIVQKKSFGEIQYIYTRRLNLGKIQSPANVIQDLAPHDISILDYILESKCRRVQSFAKAHVIDTEDVAFINMEYENGVICHAHLSWLDPLKLRDIVVVGTKQMVICESGRQKIKLYNKKVDIDKRQHLTNQSYADHLMNYEFGDVISPYIQSYEPMAAECQEFLNCIDKNNRPLSDEHMGLSVVKTLDAMQKSLKGNGKWVNI